MSGPFSELCDNQTWKRIQDAVHIVQFVVCVGDLVLLSDCHSRFRIQSVRVVVLNLARRSVSDKASGCDAPPIEGSTS